MNRLPAKITVAQYEFAECVLALRLVFAACIIMHRTVYVDITCFPPKSEFVSGAGIKIPSIMWSESENEPATTTMMVTIIIIT